MQSAKNQKHQQFERKKKEIWPKASKEKSSSEKPNDSRQPGQEKATHILVGASGKRKSPRRTIRDLVDQGGSPSKTR